MADLDGDGVGDIVMGAPEADAPGSGEGGVFVFYGGSRLATDSSFDLATVRPDVTIWGGETGARLGRAIATGDFNGDGIPDLAVGAPGEGDRFGRHDCGVVYVFYGQQGLQRGIELFGGSIAMTTIRGPVPNGYAGDSLAVANYGSGGARILEAWAIDNASVLELSWVFTRPESTHDQQRGTQRRRFHARVPPSTRFWGKSSSILVRDADRRIRRGLFRALRTGPCEDA